MPYTNGTYGLCPDHMRLKQTIAWCFQDSELFLKYQCHKNDTDLYNILMYRGPENYLFPSQQFWLLKRRKVSYKLESKYSCNGGHSVNRKVRSLHNALTTLGCAIKATGWQMSAAVLNSEDKSATRISWRDNSCWFWWTLR